MSSAESATRAGRPGWRDPRLLLGVAIMALSVVGGVLVFSSYDDSVTVLAAGRDLPAGAPFSAADATRRQVHFSDADTAARYLAPGAELPESARLARPVGEGELLPRTAFTSRDQQARVEVPLSVGADDVPATVRPGSVVDVWVVPDTPTGTRPGRAQPARRVLHDVVVVRLPGDDGGLAPRSTRQVIVALPAGDPDAVAVALGRATSGRLVLTRKD